MNAVNTATPATYWVSVDHLNRPVKMTTATKASVWDAIWQPWGGNHAITGSATLDARFPGQWFQTETSLHYNWHRSYDPTLGRYTQPDPLGFVDGPSVYGYAKGSPQRWVDRDGFFSTPQPKIPGGDLTQCGISSNICRWVTRYIPGVGKLLMFVCSALDEEERKQPPQPPNNKTIDDLISESTPGRETRGPTDQYDRPGGRTQRDIDFDSLGPTSVIDRGNGTKTGTLPDGRTVSSYDGSGGSPSISVPKPYGKTSFRYP
jgi:RHS repeat-associated protein